MKKLIYILPLLLSMVSCDWDDVGYFFLGDYVHEKGYYWEADTISHYDTVMVDGHFTLGYYDNGSLPNQKSRNPRVTVEISIAKIQIFFKNEKHITKYNKSR